MSARTSGRQLKFYLSNPLPNQQKKVLVVGFNGLNKLSIKEINDIHVNALKYKLTNYQYVGYNLTKHIKGMFSPYHTIRTL